MSKKTAESRCENYTREQLKILGWNLSKVSNGGDCLEKQELNNLPVFKEYPYRPEFVLTIDNKPVIAIECKAKCEQIEQATQEAKQYARELKLPIAIGIAGNEEDGVIVENWFFDGNFFKQVTYHNINLSQIISKKYAQYLIKTNKSELDKIELPDENRFYIEAENIHTRLRSSGIDKENMGIYLATIILAFYSNSKILSEEKFDDLELINTLAKKQLREFNKEDLIEIFNILHADKKDVNLKLKENIPFVISSLKRLDILPLLESEIDILGKFFETFLRYSNDKKELGIVFTPRHITDFMCEIAEISEFDKILDPCCGTGGFLVSAFSKIRNKLKEQSLTPKEYEEKLFNLKNNQLYGIEYESTGKLYGLACLNMIFRGDGHTNIKHKDCFTEKFDFKFNKVLINPPYAQNKNNKSGRKEIEFLDYSLKKLEKGGLLCAIIPYSIFSESSNDLWRRSLIKKHKIVVSISVPETLFYPASAPAVIVLIEAHIPHNNSEIFFAKLSDDGYDIDRNKRTKKRDGQQEKIIEEFIKWKALKKANINKEINEKQFIKTHIISNNNYLLEIVPEAFLESDDYSEEIIENTVEYIIKEQASFQLKYSKNIRALGMTPNEKANINIFFNKSLRLKKQENKLKSKLDKFFIEKKGGKGRKLNVYCSYGSKNLHNKEWLATGNQIIISSGGVENGLYGFYKYEQIYKNPIITCPSTGSIGEAFVQEIPCSVDDNTLVFELKEDSDLELLYYISAMLRLEMWRYRYGRQITPPRLNELEIDMSYYDKNAIKEFRDNLPFLVY